MYNTLVVNAFGGAGAGKTTACFYLACELKKLGYVTEYVPEYAKELVWDKNMTMLNGTPTNQRMLLNEQEKRIARLIGQVQIVVTDSPILLNSIYLKDCPEKAQYCADVLSRFNKYNNFNLVIRRDCSKFEQQGRIHTLEQSIKIDRSVENLLNSSNLYYGTYTHNTLDKIVNNIITTYKKQAERAAQMNENAEDMER